VTSTSKNAGELKVAVAAWKLAAPIANEVLVTDRSQLTVLGGLDATKLSTNAIVRVNPATGANQSAGTLTEAVHDSAGVRVGNNILVIGGGGPSENGTADVQLVTPDGRVSVVGKMPQPRSDHVAATVGGKVFVLGGYDGANIVGDVVATTDGISFTKVGALPVPVRYPAVAVLRKAIYLFGGVANTNGTDTAAIQRLDTTTGRIDIVGQLPATLSHASAVVLDNKAYLLGGYVDSVQLSDQILRFDPSTGAAMPAGHLPEPNSDAAAVAVNGLGYLVGGKSTARNPLTTVLTVTLP
jgi:N-acetylneuraminic acid mutarotase